MDIQPNSPTPDPKPSDPDFWDKMKQKLPKK